MSKLRVHYVLSTHWDREWYQSFQDYRYRLVQLLDQVLDALADNRLRGPFQTDGQAIILEDYLEIRPERRSQVEQLAQAGKLVIGPWYVLPDEFLVSGESLIRNIRLGREVARSFGAEPSNAGFMCDLFGHNSQMPQILAGFGIQGGFVWRGLNATHTRHIRWRGADGTELPTYTFSQFGYCDYAFAVRHAIQHDRPFEAVQTAADLETYLQNEAEQTEIDTMLIFDGGDHQEWDPEAYAILVKQMGQDDSPFEINHTNLDAYLADMLPQTDRIGTVVAGEMREPGRYVDGNQSWLIPGVLSSRVWIKQANAECQTLLCHWAEPMTAFAHAALQREHPQGFLAVAWRWLLKNHPHDSICGCSIDEVHEDMKFRFSQSQKIAHRLTQEATRQLAASVIGKVTADELRVVLFNPLPRPFDQTSELTLEIPADWPTFNEFFGFEPKPAFRLYNAEGQEIPYQRLGQAMNRTKFRLPGTKFPQAYKTNDIRVSLPFKIPAMGYTTLTVRRGESRQPTRYPTTPGLATGHRSMANEYLAVTIEANGTLTLTDKRNNQTYQQLLTFEDIADIGDGWFHGQAANDQAFVSTACRADVALVHNGPMLTTFRVRVTMPLPAIFHFDRMVRAEDFVELVIDNLVSLRPGVDRVEIQTTVHNTASDHRLRVLFPSGTQAETYLADSPFDVVERPIALRADNHLYRELEVETKPQQSWTALYDGLRGLAVVSTGLYESAICDQADRPLALTLFRATQRTVFTDGQPNGQLHGSMTFCYWLLPLAGEPDRTHLCYLGQELAAGLRDVQLQPKDITLHRQSTSLPPSGAFLRLDGPAVLTSARQVEEGLEVRLFNPSSETISTIIDLTGRPDPNTYPRQVQKVNFESQSLGPPEAFERGIFKTELTPKQIVTLKIT